jgi:hypothetical protein
MFLLDTTVLSELRKNEAGRANKGVIDWAEDTSEELLFVSVISIRELELGALLAERRDPPQGAALRQWLDDGVVLAFFDRILPLDVPIARRAAGFHVPDPAPERDAMIGATALMHGMAVVTRNVKDFKRFDGLEVLNPWT